MGAGPLDEQLAALRRLESKLQGYLSGVQATLKEYEVTRPHHYMNGFEILGEPKTVRLEMKFRERMHSAVLEVWISAMVATMSAEGKEKLFTYIDTIGRQHEMQVGNTKYAQVVADIPAPPLSE